MQVTTIGFILRVHLRVACSFAPQLRTQIACSECKNNTQLAYQGTKQILIKKANKKNTKHKKKIQINDK